MGFVVVSLVCLLLPACRAAMDYVSVCPEPQRCMRLSRLIMGTDHLAASAWVNTSQPAPSTQHVFDMLDAGAASARGWVAEFSRAPPRQPWTLAST